MHKLASVGLAAAIAASGGVTSGCGARTELNNQAVWNGIETPSDAGAEGGAGGSDSGVQFGKITIKNSGSLDPVIGKQPDHRNAQFEITADITEDQRINGLRLKIKSTACDSAGISGPISLFAEGKAEQIATGQYDNTGYINFDLPNGYNLFKGVSKSFYVTSQAIAPCCHSTVEAYLEKPDDLKATGMTYGMPLTVDNQYGKSNPHSSFESWWGKFQAYFNGPSSGEIPAGTKDASCMDLQINNCLPQDVEIKNWVFGIEIPNGDALPDTKDLIDDNLPQSNMTKVRLAHKLTDGTLGTTVFGPTELNPYGHDVTQKLVLNGNYSIPKGMGIKASLVFDVEDNQTLAGNQVRCVLGNLALQGAPKVTAGGQPLEADKIIPTEDITGNIHTFVAEDFPCVTVEPANVPTGAVIPKGAANVDFACWNFSNACNDTTLRTLIATHYGVGSYEDLLSYRLYHDWAAVSDIKNINLANGTITFDNLSVLFAPGTITTLCVQADVSNSASSSQHGLQITDSTDITLQPAKKIDGQFPAQGPIFVIAQ